MNTLSSQGSPSFWDQSTLSKISLHFHRSFSHDYPYMNNTTGIPYLINLAISSAHTCPYSFLPTLVNAL